VDESGTQTRFIDLPQSEAIAFNLANRMGSLQRAWFALYHRNIRPHPSVGTSVRVRPWRKYALPLALGLSSRLSKYAGRAFPEPINARSCWYQMAAFTHTLNNAES
jgi:hypothetical protein